MRDIVDTSLVPRTHLNFVPVRNLHRVPCVREHSQRQTRHKVNLIDEAEDLVAPAITLLLSAGLQRIQPVAPFQVAHLVYRGKNGQSR